jgi:hypothetical protein
VGFGPIPEFEQKQESASFATTPRKFRKNGAPDANTSSSQAVSDVERSNPSGPPERLRSLLTRQVFLFDM